MKRKTIYIFLYRIISQPKSEYRPIEFVQKQAIYIHQVNNQTNLKSVVTMTLFLIYSMCLVHLLFHNFIIRFSKITCVFPFSTTFFHFLFLE